MSDTKMRELEPLSDADVAMALGNHLNVSELWWDGRTKVGMMDDMHLKNAALTLIGMGNKDYNSPDHLKARWLIVLRLEWNKRMEQRRASKVDQKVF